MPVSKKVAFVTGSNKGIGYAIVEKLARHYNGSADWSIYLTDVEQLLIVFQTNFTSTLQFTEEFVPLLADHARVVNMCSLLGRSAFTKLSPELMRRFVAPMNMDELKNIMSEYVNHLKKHDHTNHGWPDSVYSVSKLGLIKASYILGDVLKKDWRNIVVNSCCPGYVDTDMTDHKGKKTIEEGADTPFYLATLPVGIKEPINQFVSGRKVIDVLKPPASFKM